MFFFFGGGGGGGGGGGCDSVARDNVQVEMVEPMVASLVLERDLRMQ